MTRQARFGDAQRVTDNDSFLPNVRSDIRP